MILQSIKLGMTTPEIMHFGDGHFHRVVFGLGPYIADYKEQALLACIEHTEALVEEFRLKALWDEYRIVGQLVPFTNDFPQADIHSLLLLDLLHQIIKGMFRDHPIDWVEQYIKKFNSKTDASAILDDID
ncbi:hypothetical protein PAXINDRAFT_21730 [Paxillus involutus ATCC 200175]|uniref:Uncharacterized protein n=1 Tax=Paxillus involutus ATCC 200175 TaxID=664439 RepID=A0A0C9SSX8_PAXIN|nr:hypothetical protein PAXINDRAFT_21730 [Paxillus involutus ATCC 200175]